MPERRTDPPIDPVCILASTLVLSLADDIASADPEERADALREAQDGGAERCLRLVPPRWATLLRQSLLDAERDPLSFRAYRLRVSP